MLKRTFTEKNYIVLRIHIYCDFKVSLSPVENKNWLCNKLCKIVFTT